MQLPTIDQTPHVRPSAVGRVASGANRIIPVAPVNPPDNASTKVAMTTAATSSTPTPGVIDLVNPALKTAETDPMYNGGTEPNQAGAKDDAKTPKDWTIQRAKTEKTEDPPPKPLYQVLLDHIKTIWTASASAVQLEQVSNQQLNQAPPGVAPTDAPGMLAKQVLVYSPDTIKKNEAIF